jgi:hypothetical protein
VVEAIRALMVVQRTARAQRTQTINQARAPILTGPDDVRARFTSHAPACSASTASARTPPPSCSSPPGTTPAGCGPKPHGHTYARPPRSRRRQGRQPGTGSTAAGTARPATPCGGIVITRMSSHPPTRVYVARRSKEGLSKPEIIRCLKRYAAREVYRHLRAGPT